MRISRLALSFFCGALVVFALQLQAIQAQPGGGRGWGNMFNNSLFLLNDEKVQEELGLVDDQMEQLRDLQRDARESMREMFSGMREMSREEREERMAEVQDELAEKMKELKGQVDEILLPHQTKRLDEIGFQSRARRGTANALASDELAEKLGITDQQKEELQEAAEKAQKKMQEEVAKLRKKMEDEILGVLSKEQRAKYKQLIGEPFEFQQRGWGRQRGQRGRENRPRNDF